MSERLISYELASKWQILKLIYTSSRDKKESFYLLRNCHNGSISLRHWCYENRKIKIYFKY
jgi:hypothetical protein